MPKITEHTVIFNETVLSWTADRFRKYFPLENGVFLFGEFWPSRFAIPYITQVTEPQITRRTKSAWWFEHEEIVRQTRLAAQSGRMLMGWSHSHPWQVAPFGINNQSITDARTQMHYRLSISLIVGMWPTGWWCTAWKEGFAAPLETLVHTEKEELMTLKRWYYKTYHKRGWFPEKN